METVNTILISIGALAILVGVITIFSPKLAMIIRAPERPIQKSIISIVSVSDLVDCWIYYRV